MRATAIVICAGALLATAAGARAQTIQTAHAPINLNSNAFSNFSAEPETNHWSPQPAQKSLFWDQKGHWGLKLDLNQPVGRDMQLRDVQAGAYFRITPSIRVGGAVALGDTTTFDRTNPLPQQNQQGPRVKLETSFKF
jgi:hypothetical protein